MSNESSSGTAAATGKAASQSAAASDPPAERPLRDADYQRLLAFRTELREFLRWSEQAAHEAGLTPSLHQLLLVVRGHHGPGGPTIGEAAEQLHVRHHSAVELAQRAEASGLLRRDRDPIDQRRVHLRITDLGREHVETLSRAHLSRIPALARALDRVLLAEHETSPRLGGRATGSRDLGH